MLSFRLLTQAGHEARLKGGHRRGQVHHEPDHRVKAHVEDPGTVRSPEDPVIPAGDIFLLMFMETSFTPKLIIYGFQRKMILFFFPEM